MRLPLGVSRTVAVAQGTDLVVLGGLAPGDSTTARVWRVDPIGRHVSAQKPLAQAVHDASGAMIGGRALVFGGGSSATVAAVQQWTASGASVRGKLPQPRSDSASAVVGATAYVVGGFTGAGMARDILATTDGRAFRVVGRLAIGVRYPAVAAVGGQVYVIGGALATTEGTASGAQTAAVQRFDPGTGKVKVVGSLPRPLAHAMAFAVNGNLYVAGGRHGSTATAAIVRIDVTNARTTAVGSLPRPLSDAAVAAVDGRVWLVGGETAGPSAPSNALIQVAVTRR
jgi:N-acetylneuraminic acid mutarotase